MSDPRQKTDMSDELTTIARKSYGESAFVVKCCSGSPKFWFYLGRRLVSGHDAASHEEAFRELKMKLETMAMFTELQNAKRAAEDAAETKRMVDEFTAQARRVYGPTAETEFSSLERSFCVLFNGVRVIEAREATVREAFDRAMDRLDDAAYNQLTIEQRSEFHTLASIVYPEAFRAIDCRKFVFSVVRDGTPIVSETGATMLDAYDAVMARLRAEAAKTVAASEATAAPERTTGVSNEVGALDALNVQLHREAIRVCGVGAEIRAGENKEMPYVSVSSDNFYAMRESRATAIEAREALIERLRAMPTFVPPAASVLSHFNKAVAVEMKTRLPDATPAAPTNDYLVWGLRDTMPYPDGTTFSNGSAPVNLKLSITNTTPEQKAPPTMTTPTPTAPTIAQTLTADAEAAAWMLAGSQFVKLTKEPIVALLSRHLGPGDDSLRARIAAFLDTELGTAIVAAILSGGLSAMPAPAGSQAANINARLARELRVKSMATVGDAAVDLIAGPMRQVISLYIAGAPAFPMGLPDGADRIVVPANVAAEVSR